MWRRMAHDWEFGIPEEHLAEITATLDTLFEQMRPALDRDLSTTDPVLTFRPGGPVDETL